MQNPSDSDATYDPYKGQGYQVQLSETCGEDNDVQLITVAITATMSASDSDAVDLILEDLKGQPFQHSSQIPSMAPMKIIKHVLRKILYYIVQCPGKRPRKRS